MSLSLDLEITLKDDEGFSARPYKDSRGYLTIGYGTLIDPAFPGAGLEKIEAEFILRNRIGHLITDMNVHFPWIFKSPYSPGRQLALGDMLYQMGLARLQDFHLMLAAWEAGDYEKAADECLDSDYARQTPARARRIAALIRNG